MLTINTTSHITFDKKYLQKAEYFMTADKELSNCVIKVSNKVVNLFPRRTNS